MQTTGSARTLALPATFLALALLTAGCGHRASGANGGNPVAPVATTPIEAPTTTPTPTIDAAPTPAQTPAPTPDLTAIDALLRDVDNDLQADASAGANEGTAP